MSVSECTGFRPLARAEFEATLDKVEALLGRDPGPFFLGSAVSGVDCAFAPFLERWAHQVCCTLRVRASEDLGQQCRGSGSGLCLRRAPSGASPICMSGAT